MPADRKPSFSSTRPEAGLSRKCDASSRAIVHAARHALRLPRLGAAHFLDNPASGRVLEKLGFRPVGITVPRHSIGRGGEAPSRLFELTLAEEEGQTAIAA